MDHHCHLPQDHGLISMGMPHLEKSLEAAGLSAVGDSKKWLSNFTKSSPIYSMFKLIQGVQQFKIFCFLDNFPCLKMKERNHMSISWLLNVCSWKEVHNFEFHNLHLSIITCDRHMRLREQLWRIPGSSRRLEKGSFSYVDLPQCCSWLFCGKEDSTWCQEVP